MKQYMVIAYDISSNKRRNKICDILSVYGARVNKSVFECFLTKKEFDDVKEKISENIKKGKDTVLYYFLCKDCIGKIDRIGVYSEEKEVVKVV
ncbi:CRISPR-associated endonuclease Cas2 [Candidatus Desantisbacteria bacterium]|nr:CRISPR-associated endonuclease Cas2 [Candidatus Desantisbacteria bacterium]